MLVLMVVATAFSQCATDNKQEELPVEELPPAEEVEVSEEELAKLNPQVDEEEEFNAEDASMEVVDEEDIYKDANGRLRSKSTGKYVKAEEQ